MEEMDAENVTKFVESSVQDMARIVDECKTGRFCRPLESPRIRFDELLKSVGDFINKFKTLISAASPLCLDIAKVYINQSYKDVRDLVRFASVHFRNIAEIKIAVVDTVESLRVVLLDLKRIVVDPLKQIIEETIKKIANDLKEFISLNRAALGQTALSLPLWVAGRGVLGTTAFVGRRALMATSTVAAIAIPTITIASIVYKEYKRRKMRRQIENELIIDNNCFGIRDTRVKLVSIAADFLKNAKECENKNQSNLALIYVRGNIRIREIEESLSSVDCKCYSENAIH